MDVENMDPSKLPRTVVGEDKVLRAGIPMNKSTIPDIK